MKYTDEQIAKLLKGITPGEWKVRPICSEAWEELVHKYEIHDMKYDLIASTPGYAKDSESDAAFIAAAPEIVQQQREQIAQLRMIIVELNEIPKPLTRDQIARNEAIDWAREVVNSGNWCVLDVESTGRYPQTDEPCQISIVDSDGNSLFYGHVKPTKPIEPGATGVHGITDESVTDAPTLESLIPQLAEIIKDRRVICYNWGFDGIMLNRLGLDMPQHDSGDCAMIVFAKYYGQFNDYHQSYRWQKLITAARKFDLTFGDEGAHDAQGDTRVTAQVVIGMAKSKRD